MSSLRNPVWIKMTLFFFATMLLYHPSYAGQELQDFPAAFQYTKNKLPVTYVDEVQARQLIREYQRKGYVVTQGTLAQLDQLMLASNAESTTENDSKKTDTQESKEGEEAQNEQDGDAESPVQQAPLLQDELEKQTAPGSTSEPVPAPLPEPMPEPLPPSAPPPQSTSQTSVGVYTDLSYGSGGNNSDLAKVFFIVAGFVVVAAFVVYAGKYVADMIHGKDHDLWWELIFNSTFMGTDSGEHGRFYGVKIATGFVSSDLIQVALVGEVGNTDLDLVLNKNDSPMGLDLTANYWMLGATARLHLTDKLVNASYLYLEFMGGKTDHSDTDTIGAARLGASFGVNDYVRLGASLGAQYIGLNEDQGFVNDGNNYWFTYGIEMGVRF